MMQHTAEIRRRHRCVGYADIAAFTKPTAIPATLWEIANSNQFFDDNLVNTPQSYTKLCKHTCYRGCYSLLSRLNNSSQKHRHRHHHHHQQGPRTRCPLVSTAGFNHLTPLWSVCRLHHWVCVNPRYIIPTSSIHHVLHQLLPPKRFDCGYLRRPRRHELLWW